MLKNTGAEVRAAARFSCQGFALMQIPIQGPNSELQIMEMTPGDAARLALQMSLLPTEAPTQSYPALRSLGGALECFSGTGPEGGWSEL